MELGILRESEDDDNPVPDNQSWVSLLTGVNSMEIRYFDPRLNRLGRSLDRSRHAAASGSPNDRSRGLARCRGRRCSCCGAHRS